jgi:hypothetical protein
LAEAHHFETSAFEQISMRKLLARALLALIIGSGVAVVSPWFRDLRSMVLFSDEVLDRVLFLMVAEASSRPNGAREADVGGVHPPPRRSQGFPTFDCPTLISG